MLDWIVWLFSFLGVLGLIVLLFYALKKLNKRVSVGSGSKLRVLDRVNLGRDGMLLVVSVDGKLMLIGVTPQRVEKLCDMESTEEEYLSGNETQDFRSALASVLWKKQNGKSGSESEEDGKTDG
ncbi:MAG: flagellar biosynthetic protein FliO [Bacteroides sp.]|nr:flagellar biosynthetic protein FliO [Bacteroides sp.]